MGGVVKAGQTGGVEGAQQVWCDSVRKVKAKGVSGPMTREGSVKGGAEESDVLGGGFVSWVRG